MALRQTQHGFALAPLDHDAERALEQLHERCVIAGAKRAAETLCGQPRIGNHEAVLVLAVEISDDFGKRHVDVLQAAFLPRERLIDFVR